VPALIYLSVFKLLLYYSLASWEILETSVDNMYVGYMYLPNSYYFIFYSDLSFLNEQRLKTHKTLVHIYRISLLEEWQLRKVNFSRNQFYNFLGRRLLITQLLAKRKIFFSTILVIFGLWEPQIKYCLYVFRIIKKSNFTG
jgi:hypothetical protein